MGNFVPELRDQRDVFGWAKRLVGYLRSTILRGGRGILVQQTDSGTTVSLGNHAADHAPGGKDEIRFKSLDIIEGEDEKTIALDPADENFLADRIFAVKADGTVTEWRTITDLLDGMTGFAAGKVFAVASGGSSLEWISVGNVTESGTTPFQSGKLVIASGTAHELLGTLIGINLAGATYNGYLDTAISTDARVAQIADARIVAAGGEEGVTNPADLLALLNELFGESTPAEFLYVGDDGVTAGGLQTIEPNALIKDTATPQDFNIAYFYGTNKLRALAQPSVDSFLAMDGGTIGLRWVARTAGVTESATTPIVSGKIVLGSATAHELVGSAFGISSHGAAYAGYADTDLATAAKVAVIADARAVAVAGNVRENAAVPFVNGKLVLGSSTAKQLSGTAIGISIYGAAYGGWADTDVATNARAAVIADARFTANFPAQNVTGSGTAAQIAVFSAANVIGSSTLIALLNTLFGNSTPSKFIYHGASGVTSGGLQTIDPEAVRKDSVNPQDFNIAYFYGGNKIRALAQPSVDSVLAMDGGTIGLRWIARTADVKESATTPIQAGKLVLGSATARELVGTGFGISLHGAVYAGYADTDVTTAAKVAAIADARIGAIGATGNVKESVSTPIAAGKLVLGSATAHEVVGTAFGIDANGAAYGGYADDEVPTSATVAVIADARAAAAIPWNNLIGGGTATQIAVFSSTHGIGSSTLIALLNALFGTSTPAQFIYHGASGVTSGGLQTIDPDAVTKSGSPQAGTIPYFANANTVAALAKPSVDSILASDSGSLGTRWVARTEIGGTPSTAGKSRYMTLQLDANLNPVWDYVRAH